MRRIAVLGFSLESNRFAPVCGREDFMRRGYFKGAEITEQARAENPYIDNSICGFYAAMDRAFGSANKWEPVPILFAASFPAGAVDESFFKELLRDFKAGLEEKGPYDGVYICEHGGAIATHTHDPDGDVFKTVRQAVGDDVPVISTLDLHCNISEVMMDNVDVMVGYRTNPHVDLYERGEEAAACMIEMFNGVKPYMAKVRLPLVAPSVTQLTAEGYPYRELIDMGQEMVGTEIMNVSVVTGFAFADTPKNGLTVMVTARDSMETAEKAATEIATKGWEIRERFKTNMIALQEAARLAKEVGEDPSLPSLLFADPADNPGGGGRGNTTYILKAFLDAGVEGCLLGVFNDPALVARAIEVGEGGTFEAHFNSAEDTQFSEPLTANATVASLHDGKFVGRHGMISGKSADVGDTAVLDLGGIHVVVISNRQQCLSTDFIDSFGLDCASARSVIVKSRGHFRAGFDYLFGPERTHEVDVPGLTSPNLANFDWKYLPRPVFPLDEEATWSADEA